MTKLSVLAMLVAMSTTALADKDKGRDKDKDKDDEPDFAGSYTYTGVYTMSLSAPKRSFWRSSKVPATLTKTDDGHLTITESKKGGFVLTFNAKGETCQLSAARSGKATLKPSPGQTCNVVDKSAKADFTMTLTLGSGSLAGDSLNFQMSWKLSGSVGGVAVTGSATEIVQAEAQ
jgi:hypothetical protein